MYKIAYHWFGVCIICEDPKSGIEGNVVRWSRSGNLLLKTPKGHYPFSESDLFNERTNWYCKTCYE